MKLPATIAATLAASLAAALLAGAAAAQTSVPTADDAAEGMAGDVPADDGVVEEEMAPTGQVMAVPEGAPTRGEEGAVDDSVDEALEAAEKDIKRSEEFEKKPRE